jgi:hypothetical protein
VKTGVNSCNLFLLQEAKLLKINLLICICTIALWNKNVKSMFQEESDGLPHEKMSPFYAEGDM